MAKLNSIDMPWGKGLGTLGFNFATKHVDFSFNWGRHLIMFVALYAGAASEHRVQQRSWYCLTWHGWQLQRREDAFGRWYRNALSGGQWEVCGHGYRRVPLLARPASIPQRAWELRQQFKPYQLVDWYGQQLEVISFPSPERNSVIVMMRQRNDPTTLQEVTLEQYA